MDAELLETSLALVDTPGSGLTDRFYAILFERHPSLRPMFGADAARQATMLRSAVISVVDHLDDPVWLAETLGDLGARHARWGVVPGTYRAVAGCMVAAMAEIGGARWTPQMSDARLEALGVGGAARRGGRPPAARPPGGRRAGQLSATGGRVARAVVPSCRTHLWG